MIKSVAVILSAIFLFSILGTALVSADDPELTPMNFDESYGETDEVSSYAMFCSNRYVYGWIYVTGRKPPITTNWVTGCADG